LRESHGDSSDDSEFQHALEVGFDLGQKLTSPTLTGDQVVFNPENAHRRKSSLVPGEAAKLATRQADQRKASSCIVHKFLEKERQHFDTKLPYIEEDRVRKGDVDGTSTPQEDMQIVRSRLLTKKQLADMAMGVRSLAKKLGSLKVKLKIKSVFVLTKIHDPTLIAKTREVVSWLLCEERDAPYIVWVENILEHNETFDAKGLTAEHPSYQGRLKYWDSEVTKKHPQTFDFVVTLGGDGTVLYASWLFQRVVPPVLSFALGSLGFLTKFDFEQYRSTLTKAFRDGVTISLRLRFEGTIMRSRSYVQARDERDLVEELIGEEREDNRTHRPERTFEILNDIVVDRGPSPSKL
jgi:NAD+ kinase